MYEFYINVCVYVSSFNEEMIIIMTCTFQVKRPQSLLEASRVTARDQITLASSGRSILPSIEVLPLPKQLKKYLALVDDLWG